VHEINQKMNFSLIDKLLKPNDIEHNPVQKEFFKSSLCGLAGKFGSNSANYYQTEFTQDFSYVQKMFSENRLHDIDLLTDSVIQLTLNLT
jgi:hypothetical protein